MKKFLLLATMVLGVVSCMKDQSFEADGGESKVVLSVALPEGATRAAGENSALGAIDNIIDLATKYDIRYVLAVYDDAGRLAKDQIVKTEDEATSTQFELRLVPGRDYRFVVWADFVAEGTTESLHYNTADLTNVTLKDGSEQLPMDESRDAYTAVKKIEKFNSASEVKMTLTRPFAKLRVVTNDMKEIYSELEKATVTYYANEVYTAFNALTAAVAGEPETESIVKVAVLNDEDYQYTNEDGTAKMTLFADYLFGTVDGTVKFSMDIKDNSGYTIPTIQFNTNIPVERNHLTTIYGPILTDFNKVTVTIDEAFEGYIDNNTDNGELSKTVNTAADFAEEFADDEVDVIVLNGDINLDDLATRAADISLTVAAGKTLTIDLNGYTLSATSTQTGKNYNVFDVRGILTVKNGTMEYKHIGENMEWGNSTNLFNITAGGVLNLEGVAAKNLGGSDMAFVAHLNNWGEATLNVENSTLESTYIAVRAFNSGYDMNNIAIYNSTLKAKYCFWVHNYKAAGDSAGTDETLNVDIFNGTNTFEYTGKAPVLYGFNNPIYFTEEGIQIYDDAAALAAALTADKENIAVALGSDIDLPISSLGQITGGSGEYKLGGENTKTITIDLNGKKLNITTTYWSNLGAKNADALFTIKNGTMTSSQATGTWNSYDLCFSNCNYAFENVDFLKAIALESAGKTFNLKNITIAESHDYYAMWITAEGQTVNVENLAINSQGRGIKIDEQYVDAPAKVTLNINVAEFTTAKKAAILVKSVAGAEIDLKNVDITAVAADDTFAVWVDEDSKDYAHLVKVNGAYAKVEGSVVSFVENAEELKAALAAGNGVIFKNDITVAATKGGYTKAGILQNKAQTIDGNGYTLTVTGAGATWDCAIYTNGGTIKNLTVKGAMRGIFTAGQSSDLNIENVEFKNVIYTFNSDGKMPANPFGVYVSNSALNGWTSHSDMHTEVVYTNCSFGEGSGYKYCRPYGKTAFVNCTFCPGFSIDKSRTTDLTFTNCIFEE